MGVDEVLDVVRIAGTITLGQLLKVRGVARSGGAAKHLVRTGRVRVNGTVETRRGRRLGAGDIVEIDGQVLVVAEA